MERIEEFIEALKEKGIRIWSDNEKLRYQAAKGLWTVRHWKRSRKRKLKFWNF